MLHAWYSVDGLAAALQQIAHAAGAEGATLTYSFRSTQLGAATSESLLEHVAPYLSDDRPRDPRPARVNPTLAEGFRLDQDDFSRDEIDSDPFYQEFLRPRGFGWHACALLSGSPSAETVNLSLRRTTRQGMFEESQLAGLSAQLPLIRALAASAQMAGSLQGAGADLEADRTLFGFDARGAAFVVRRGSHGAEVLEARGGRLVAHDAETQDRVKATIARAHGHSRQTSSILIDANGGWWLLSVVPASAMAPMGMTPMVSWAVLSPYERSEAYNAERVRQLAALFGLSAAEARVAGLIGDAKTIASVARTLSTSPGTVRNHLKSIFAKVGVNRQAELVAILSRL
jgi:DNA-binding CsgD family transcriptional regulator